MSNLYIIKAPHEVIKINAFRRGDRIYLDIEKEQYSISLKGIKELEDLDKRSNLCV